MTTTDNLFSREELARAIALPESLTLRRAISLACRHARLAEDEPDDDCGRHSRCRRCWGEGCTVLRAHERLEDAIAAFRGNELVAFCIDNLMTTIRCKLENNRRHPSKGAPGRWELARALRTGGR